MFIADVLSSKGADVATVTAPTPLPELMQLLSSRKIGAVVVTADDGAVAGIVSERDIVRRLSDLGAELLAATVQDLMTAEVCTCTRADAVDGVLQIMTERRIRHIPVVEDGALVGIVSIGDLVKIRMDELQSERDQLEAYISG